MMGEKRIRLSEEDLEKIKELRKFGILADVNGHHLNQKNGVIMISCADGHQMYDIFGHQLKMQEGHCQDLCVHTLAWNGGALRIPQYSPANKKDRTTHLDVIDDIRDSIKIKNIHTIALYVHAPCGKAHACGINFIEMIGLLIDAKIRIKKEVDNIYVACFIHIDFNNNRKRTYFISRKKWIEWREKIIIANIKTTG